MAFDLLDLAEIFLVRRFIIPFVIGIGIAVGAYYLGGQTPAAAAVAFAIGAAGLCLGLVLHFAGGKSASK